MKSKDTQLLEQAYQSIHEQNRVAQDATKAFELFAGGVSAGWIARAAMLAMQGRYEEAESIIAPRIKDSSKKKQVVDYLKTIKPIKGATTSKLAEDPQISEWIYKHFVPFVQSNIRK